MIRRLIFILIFLPFSISVLAQEKDFGIWYGVSAEHKLSKKFSLDMSTDVRTFENASKIDEAFIEGGVNFDFNKYISAEGSYRLTKSIEKDDNYYYQHKFFLNLKGKLPVDRFTFSGSLRLQTRTKTYIEDSEDENADYQGKIRLKATYRTVSFPVDPYIYSEAFIPLFSDKTGIGKVRYSAGFDIKFTQKHSIQLEYIYQRDYLPHLSDLNVISVNYNIKF
jgi:hypothetical protein